MQPTVIAPSILSANFARLGEGEAGAFTGCVEAHPVPPNARPWMAGPGTCAMDGCSPEIH